MGVIMERRITAVFDNRDQAEYARKELLLAGFDSDALILIEGYDSSDETEASDAGVATGGSYTIADDTQNFFRNMFLSSEEAAEQVRWEAVRRGKVVLEVDAESQADFEIAVDIIEDLRLDWTDFGA